MAASSLLPRDTLDFKDISVFAIRRWRLLLTGCIGLVVLAVLAWTKMPRREDPDVDLNEAAIVLIYPGASPDDVETKVVRPVEDVLNTVDGIETLESSALPSQAVFHIKFIEKIAIDSALERVRGKVQAKKRELPSEVQDPEIIRYGSSLTPQMVLAVTGNRSEAVLTEAAKKLKDALGSVEGVAKIDLIGQQQRAIRVRLDTQRLADYHLSVEQVVRQLKLANVRIPAGDLRVGSVMTVLQINQEFASAAYVAKMPVGAILDPQGGTRTLTLGQVAEVRDSARTPQSRFVYNQQPAVGLALRFRSGDDALAVGKRVRLLLPELQASFPSGVSAVVAHDQPNWTKTAIGGFTESMEEGIILVMLVVTLGMGWRPALVVAGVLPLAISGALLGLYLAGFALQQVAIAGLIIAIGLLVDDAVVVTESIQLMLDKGLSPVRAAVFGTARVFWANNSTTAVACSSFLPLFFMPGKTGMFVKAMPTVVVLALFTSLLVAQFFTPWATTKLLKRAPGVPAIPDTQPFSRDKDQAADGHEERNPIFRWLRAGYTSMTPWVVRHAFTVFLIATAMLIGAGMLIPKIGFEFFSHADKPVLFVSIQTIPGAHPEATEEKLFQVIRMLHQEPEVRDTSATIGAGYPPIFIGRAAPGPGSNVADLLVRLDPESSVAAVAAKLRKRMASVSGAFIKVEELYNGPAVTHPIIIRVHGDRYEKLREYSEELQAKLKEHPGTLNVSDSLSQSIPISRVQMLAERAMRVGLTPGQVGSSLRWLYGEDKVTEFIQGDDRVEVILDYPAQSDSPLAQVENTLIPSAPGRMVPLREVAELSLVHDFTELKRRNGRRVVEITADVDASMLPATVIQHLDPWLKAKKWEPGYGFSYGGTQEEIEASNRSLGLSGASTMLIIFLLLILLFDQFALSVVILMAVPYVLIGAVFGLYITGHPFSFMASLGLIALIGVYVNHKIYFTDRMLLLMNRGQDLTTAILNAGRDRLRPVVLTALTAVLGLLPLALGKGTDWTAFAWVNIFGLLASIPLSLILLPALIVLLYRLRKPPPTPNGEAEEKSSEIAA